MKKTKLLTSVAALALVLSLGACNQPEDDSTGSEETSSETSSSSSSTSTEQEKVTLTNYTISITLKDEAGEPVVIPFYDSVYICGSWDSWAEWTVLTDIGDETESVLTTTFASIEEGTYNFKGVVGGQEETPSWNLTELIVSSTGGDVSFEVNAEDGDNYTNNLEFTVDVTKIPVLDETPMDDETIMGLMLAAAEADYDEPWEALHGQSVEDGAVSVEVWFTTDEDEALYGKSIAYDEEDGDTTKFIVSGTAYVVDGDGEYTTQNYANDYEDELDNYAAALSEFAYASVEDLGENATLTHEEGSSFYTLTWADTYTEVLVCQRAGDEFSVTRVEEYDPDGDGAIAEKISAAEVEALMVDFNHLYWDNAATPMEFIDKACLTGNYSIQIVLDQFESDYILYEDYAAGNYDLDSLYETMSFAEEYVIYAYYTEDALLIDFYLNFYGYLILVEEDLYVNTLLYGFLPCCDCYFTDGETWYYYGSYVGYEWQGLFWSLFDNPDYFGFDDTDFSLLTSVDGVDVYDFTSYDAMYYFALLTGADIWSSTYANPYYLASFDYLYFSAEEEMMQTSYYGTGWVYGDYTYSTVAYYQRQFVTTFYDVGETEIDEELIAYVEENAEVYDEDD